VIERTEEKDIYNLSRLGIPLIEIATAPDITSADECKAVAAKIGMILRSCDNMKRGIGSIRQDVNMSIKGDDRVEVKGFQDLKSIPAVIENEVKRQIEAIEAGEHEAHVRKAEDDNTTSYLRPMPGAARMYPETDIPKIEPDTDDIDEPMLLDERAEHLENEYELPDGYGMQLVQAHIDYDDYAATFEHIDRTFLADFFIKIPKDLKSREDVDVNPEEHLDVIEQLDDGTIPKSAVDEILLAKAQGEDIDYTAYEKISDTELRDAVEAIVADDPDAPMGALMGQVMGRFKGQVEGERARRVVQDVLDDS
jgi:Glu-tRNA(Gln) amidotransferase subunit E-like FAD-binding protein